MLGYRRLRWGSLQLLFNDRYFRLVSVSLRRSKNLLTRLGRSKNSQCPSPGFVIQEKFRAFHFAVVRKCSKTHFVDTPVQFFVSALITSEVLQNSNLIDRLPTVSGLNYAVIDPIYAVIGPIGLYLVTPRHKICYNMFLPRCILCRAVLAMPVRPTA